MMAKRKTRQKKTRIPPLSIPSTTNQIDPCAQRLSNLAMELTLAGGQVLREDFDFSQTQVNVWLEKTLIRAQQNREDGQNRKG